MFTLRKCIIIAFYLNRKKTAFSAPVSAPWNSLPQDVMIISTMAMFKVALEKHSDIIEMQYFPSFYKACCTLLFFFFDNKIDKLIDNYYV